MKIIKNSLGREIQKFKFEKFEKIQKFKKFKNSKKFGKFKTNWKLKNNSFGKEMNQIWMNEIDVDWLPNSEIKISFDLNENYIINPFLKNRI